MWKSYQTHIHLEIFKQDPHVVAGIDFFHLYLSVHIAMVQEVYVCGFNLCNYDQNKSGKYPGIDTLITNTS